MMKIKKMVEDQKDSKDVSNLNDLQLPDAPENSGTQYNSSYHERSQTSNGKQKFTEDEEFLMYLKLRSGSKNLWKKLEKFFGDYRSKQEVIYHVNYWLCQKQGSSKYKQQFVAFVRSKCKDKGIQYEDIDFVIDESQDQQNLSEYQAFVRKIENELEKYLFE